MQRVLSFQMARGIDESSEYVTKRLCFSFIFSVAFLCLLCGFLLGRFATERSMESRAEKMRFELVGNGLQSTDFLQQLVLRELDSAPFDYERVTKWKTANSIEVDMKRINKFFSNLSFIDEVVDRASCVRATVRGSREPDRYVVLSVNGDGIIVALELAQSLDRIYSANEQRPRRSLIFCVSPASSDSCPRALSRFTKRKIVAYVAVYGHSIRGIANGRVALSGSDVMRSIAVEAIKTIPGDGNWTYLEHEIFGPRLSLDIPHVSFSFNENSFAYNQTHHNQSLQSRGIILARMISRTIWRLSDSIIIQWEPTYFNETVNKILESIDAEKSRDVKANLRRKLTALLIEMKDLNTKINTTENTPTLHVRLWNDLLLDLDRALLCPDENLRSKTDLAILRKLSHESIGDTLSYLEEMAKCYEDAIQVLAER